MTIDTKGLARPQGGLPPPGYAAQPPAKLVLHIHREVIHHGAKVCLFRDLYRSGRQPIRRP